MTREEFQQLSTAYAAGSLEGGDLLRFGEYLRTAGPQDLKELAELLETAALLPLALDRQNAPGRVRDSLLQRIKLLSKAEDAVEARTGEGVGGIPRPSGWRRWMPFGATFAMVAMVIGFAIYVSSLMDTIDRQNRRLVSLETELMRTTELLQVLSARSVDMVMMSGTPDHPVAHGKIIWDPEKRVAILHVSRLPAVPPDRDYQLWVIKGNQPINAGVFTVGALESYYFKVEQLAVTDPREIAAFAITLEPKGGVPAPTGAMYMVGSPKL